MVREYETSKGVVAGSGGKALLGLEAYERMRRETEPQGYARMKPLRG
jgi:hypothetical protein